MTPDASAVVTFHRNHWKGSPEYALKHCFIVIGEKHGSEGSDYPLRELISRRSITKAVPMKDPVSGQVKTETITVNGPISLAETTTKGDVNPENLSRSFVVGIDESEDQTRLIHDRQRTNYTVDGFLERRSLDRITERHHFAQRFARAGAGLQPLCGGVDLPGLHTEDPARP